MANDDERLERIEKRLDLIAHLLLLSVDRNKLPAITDQIALLVDHGLAPVDIGKVIGRKANYVSAMTKNRKPGGKNA